MTEPKHPSITPLPDPVPAAPPTVDLQADPTPAAVPEPTPEPEARSTPSVPDIPPPPSTPAPVPRQPTRVAEPEPVWPDPETDAELERFGVDRSSNGDDYDSAPWSRPWEEDHDEADEEAGQAPLPPSSPTDRRFAEQEFTDIHGNTKRLRDLSEPELAGGFWPREAYEAWKTWRRHVEGV